jgi:hypothetical protein
MDAGWLGFDPLAAQHTNFPNTATSIFNVVVTVYYQSFIDFTSMHSNLLTVVHSYEILMQFASFFNSFTVELSIV